MTDSGGAGERNVVVRAANERDAAAIAAIYNEGIRERVATFETAERSADDVRAWFAGVPGAPAYPMLVATEDAVSGEASLFGWVRASSYRPRDAYRSIAEFSVYVAASARRRGVGDALMASFTVACGSAGFAKLVSRIFPENAASRALCARHGFREVGVYEKHGKLDGRWRDVVIVERLLQGNL